VTGSPAIAARDVSRSTISAEIECVAAEPSVFAFAVKSAAVRSAEIEIVSEPSPASTVLAALVLPKSQTVKVKVSSPDPPFNVSTVSS
jgi:hypothetical protein